MIGALQKPQTSIGSSLLIQIANKCVINAEKNTLNMSKKEKKKKKERT